jgi:hypothetical protein
MTNNPNSFYFGFKKTNTIQPTEQFKATLFFLNNQQSGKPRVFLSSRLQESIHGRPHGLPLSLPPTRIAVTQAINVPHADAS